MSTSKVNNELKAYVCLWYISYLKFKPTKEFILQTKDNVAKLRAVFWSYAIRLSLETWASAGEGKGGILPPLAGQGRPKIVCF